MKKILILGLITLSCTLNAQTNETKTQYPPTKTVEIVKEKQRDNSSFYVNIGLSLSTHNDVNFKDESYASLGFGITKSQLSLGIQIGRDNFAEFNHDNIERYFYKGMINYTYQTADILNPYLLFGVGNYIDRNHFFIEYGFGLQRSISNFSLSLQASNFDKNWYITPGLTYNFD